MGLPSGPDADAPRDSLPRRHGADGGEARHAHIIDIPVRFAEVRAVQQCAAPGIERIGRLSVNRLFHPLQVAVIDVGRSAASYRADAMHGVSGSVIAGDGRSSFSTIHTVYQPAEIGS